MRQPLIRAACAALLFSPCAAAAQIEAPHRPVRFERAPVEPLLPQSSVYVIHQDRRGLLWFATREGLGRWDGYTMHTWKATPFDPNALPGNVVRRLVEDSAGSLWIAAQPNDRLPLRVARLSGPGHARVERLPWDDAIPFVDHTGAPWIVDPDSIRRFDGERFEAVGARLRHTPPAAAYRDRRGRLWIGDIAGGIELHENGAARAFEADAPARRNPEASLVASFFEDDRGQLWLLGHGVRRLDADGVAFRFPRALPSPLDTVGTAQLLQDADGWLWLASLDGVYRFDPSLTRVERHTLHLPGEVSTQNWVLSLLHERSGAIWAGTPWGLHRYDPDADPFGFLGHDPRDARTLGSGLVLSLLEDGTGALWVGTLGGGLNRIDRNTGAVRRFREGDGGLNHDWVWSLADAGAGRVWAATGRGVDLIDPGATVPARAIDVGPTHTPWTESAAALLPDGAGGLWLGRDAHIVHRAADGTLRRIALPTPAETQQILPDGTRLWAATTAGLVLVDRRTGDTRSFRHNEDDARSLSHDVVLSLHRDRDGRLWVGTNSGLNRLEPDSTFTHFGERDGFPSSVIYSILEDEERRLWMGTNRGLIRFDPHAPPGFGVRVYDARSGAGNVEFNRNAALRTRDGTFWFGGDRGVTYFDPSSVRDNTWQPPVILAALHRATSRGTRTDAHVAGAPVMLAPDDYTVTFELAALNYSNPERNQYEYMLDGFDPQWVRAGTNRFASYTNVPPGRYVFRARAANDDGLWSDDVLAQVVIVEPWFWETWWFRALALLFLIGVVAAATAWVLHERHRRELAALRYREALEDERSRISRDMHDEVGASLTEIAILSDLALRRNGEAAQARRDLEKISARSRAMLDAIGEIVWALNPAHDRARHLASYLRAYASEVAESAGLNAELAFDDAADVSLSSEYRRNVFLIAKEALANAANHARARTVRVELDISEGRLRLVIVDDGIGFAGADRAQGHDGLANMGRRAHALGARLTVESEPGRGTRIELDAPLPVAVEA